MEFLGRKVSLGSPKHAEVVIFDECNSHVVEKVIPDHLSYVVFHVRPEVIILSLRVLKRLISNVVFFELDKCKRNQSLLRHLLSQVKKIYLKACVDEIQPRLVISFIDNLSHLHFLSRHATAYKVAAIQNGARLLFNSQFDENYHLDYFFCFGQRDKKMMQSFGCSIQNYIPVGSLMASLYSDLSLLNKPPKYDILVVSTWRGNINGEDGFEDTMRGMKTMDELLARYIRSRELRVAVILRAERDSEHWDVEGWGTEELYFRTIYGQDVEIIENVFSKRPIYNAMLSSELTVSCLSTALLEAYGFGKKI